MYAGLPDSITPKGEVPFARAKMQVPTALVAATVLLVAAPLASASHRDDRDRGFEVDP